MLDFEMREKYENHDATLVRFFKLVMASVTRLGDLLDFGQVFKAFGNN